MSSVADDLAGARAIRRILEELHRAEDKHPGWHEDPLRQAAIIVEEAGEVMQATLNMIEAKEAGNAPLWETSDFYDRILHEVAQTGAMALRYLLNYERQQGDACTRPTETES